MNFCFNTKKKKNGVFACTGIDINGWCSSAGKNQLIYFINFSATVIWRIEIFFGFIVQK